MEFILMLICVIMYVTVLKDSNTYIEDTTSIEVSNNEEIVENHEVVVSALQRSIIWVLNSDLEDKRERLVELLRVMIGYTDTSEFLERNPNVFKYIFENT